ncbi:MAG: hypothetical protein IPH48_16885 [bacterium]|nr:hypothetical protein [bacterium]
MAIRASVALYVDSTEAFSNSVQFMATSPWNGGGAGGAAAPYSNCGRVNLGIRRHNTTAGGENKAKIDAQFACAATGPR